jgi:alkylation response protein AidB-like acyl-CoA dehydrogenase
MEADPRGYSPALWREMAALGWPGMALPADHGGGALGFLEVALLLEEMGRVLLPAPFLETTVLAAPLLMALGGTHWLPRLARGEVIATVALTEPGGSDEWREPTLAARSRGDRVILAGTKRFVAFAPDADLMLVVAAGPTLVAIERGAAGVACERLATLGGTPLYEVRFADAVGISLGHPDTVAPALERMRLHAPVAALAYAVGAAERALEMTVAHAKTRVQFGRPIGSFQAVAHRCADMRSDLDAIRYLVYQAAWSLAAGRDAALEVSAAKAYGNEALRRLFMHAHQVHGAIGFSTEHDLQLFTRRAKALELQWGSTTMHRERIARAMGL